MCIRPREHLGQIEAGDGGVEEWYPQENLKLVVNLMHLNKLKQ